MVARIGDPLRAELRRLRRRPLLTATVIVVTALAVAATTTLAAVARHFVLRPLPGVSAQHELVNLHRAEPDDPFGGFSLDEYRALAAEVDSLAAIAAFRDQGVSLVLDGEPALAVAQVVSGNYFAALRSRAAAGRLLGAGDDRPGAPPVAVLDHTLWLRRFGGDPAVVGRAIRVNGESFEVVGVAPPGFAGTFLAFRFDLFLPLAQIERADPAFAAGGPERHRLELLARRRADVPAAALAAELARHAETFRRAAPERWRDATFAVAPTTGVEPSLAGAARLFFAALGALGALALAVVATNLGGLLLADLLERRHELAVRAALGGSRTRLLAPLVRQTTLLCGAGGALGVGLAFAAARAVAARSASLSLPFDVALEPGLPGLVVGLGLALALGLAVALAAAWRIARVRPVEALTTSRTAGAAGGRRPRARLVAAQVLGSVVLLALALVFAGDARAARDADLGLRLDDLAVLDLNVGLLGLPPAEQTAAVERTLARLAAIPGVDAVAAAAPFPLAFGQPARAVGRSAQPAEAAPTAVAVVSADYFDLLGLPLVAGRGFAKGDGAGAPAVAIVNETFAATWGGVDAPVERLVFVDGAPARVVGVARDSRSRRPWEAPRPMLYLPLAQTPTPRLTVALRHRGDLATLALAVRAALRETVPDLGAPPPRPAAAQLATLLLPQRAAAGVAAALGALAALLSALGLYALVARQVVAARREIGVRQALGASAATIRRQFLGRALRPAAAGALLALPLVVAAARAVRPLLPATGGDAWSGYLLAVALLAAVAFAAGWFPAQLAARISPAAALRQD